VGINKNYSFRKRKQAKIALKKSLFDNYSKSFYLYYQMPSDEIKNLAAQYARHLEDKEKNLLEKTEKIHVDEIASQIASFYEKVRNVIDYREEHLLRKNAIERVLRRRVFLKDFDKNFAEALIKELIRLGHLPNDSVPESKIPEIQKIIDNLVFLMDYPYSNDTEAKNEIVEWLIDITVSTIEEELFDLRKEKMLADFMFQTIRKKLVIKNATLTDSERDIQLFIAVQKTLFRPDKTQLQYRLLKFAYPNWGKFSTEELNNIARDIFNIKNAFENHLKHKLAPHFLRLVSRQKIVFLLIGDLIFDSRDINRNLEQEIESVYLARYARETKQLNRLAFLSVISFLISKILVAVAIEIPLDKYLTHSFSWLATGASIVFPPLLMLIIVIFIKMPSSKNLVLASEEIKSLINDQRKEYVLVIPKKKNWFAEIFVRIVYLAVFVAILYFLVKFLLFLHFSPASIVIFCLFTSMVIATGVKIKNRTREINLEKEKATILNFLLDLVTIPFMTIGQGVITTLSKFNIFVIIFNLAIELPFQLFVEFIENFRGFLNSKKEETN